jgi:hypothetical protein
LSVLFPCPQSDPASQTTAHFLLRR